MLTLNTVNQDVEARSPVSETNYTGQFTPSSTDCSGIATFSPVARDIEFHQSLRPARERVHILLLRRSRRQRDRRRSSSTDAFGAVSRHPIAFGDVNVTIAGLDERQTLYW